MPNWKRRVAKIMVLAMLWANMQVSLEGLHVGGRPAHAAGPIADPNAALAFKPGIVQGVGGVPLVNITRPNAAGLSLNQYQRFDVGSQGVVLNNSLLGGGSLIGGRVEANPNLNDGRTASTIVNEVTVAGPSSRLTGALEVFGAPAAIIVANPNGIACDGCGVVNTPRFTLTTGVPKPVDGGGQASGFDDAARFAYAVGGGHIQVDGSGIEGTVGRLDLIAGSLGIDAPLRAHYLNGDLSSINLATGQGLVDEHGDGAYANRSPVAGAAAPMGYAIDASLLGAMTAGQIRVIATDAGMGVNLRAPLIANQQDIHIDSAGPTRLGSLAAAGGIRLDSEGNLNLDEGFLAGGGVQANTAGDLHLKGNAAAQIGRAHV
jgi:filamentous hemagglutinin family protein